MVFLSQCDTLCAQVELELINEQEAIFGWNPTVNPTIAAGLTELEPYETFFRTVSDSQRSIQSWYSEPIIGLVPEQVSLTCMRLVSHRIFFYRLGWR